MAAESEISRAMLEYEQRWSPYGGGRDGDILTEFGLTSHVFFERILALLASEPNVLDPRVETSIRAVARRRLGRVSPSANGCT